MNFVDLKTLPGVSFRQRLFSSCSVWAWRKPGINSWLRAEPTCRTAFRKRWGKTLKKVKKEKKGSVLYGNTFRIPGPQTQKKTPTIYIYIKGCQKKGGVLFSFLGFKKMGSLNPQKPQKPQKYPQTSLLADNPKKDTPPKPSKTPLSELLAENPKMTKKPFRGPPKSPKTSEKCQNLLFNTKKHVDVYWLRRVHPKAF